MGTIDNMAHMMGDQAIARSCYVRADDSKTVLKEEEHKMGGTVYQLGDEFPCDIKEGGTFGKMYQREETMHRRVETPDELTPVMMEDAKPEQVAFL